MFQKFKSFSTFKLCSDPIRSDGLNDLNGVNYLNRLRAAVFVVKSPPLKALSQPAFEQ